MRLPNDRPPAPVSRLGAAWGRCLVYLRRPRRWAVPVASAFLLCLLLYLRILDERVPWEVGQRAPRGIVAHADTW